MKGKEWVPPDPEPEITDKFYLNAFMLYDETDVNIGDFVSNRGGWLSSISGDLCSISIFENPEKWGKYWISEMERIYGEKFDKFFSDAKKLDPSDRNRSIKIAKDLNIQQKDLPCIVFSESWKSPKYLAYPIIDDKELYEDFFTELFDVVVYVNGHYTHTEQLAMLEKNMKHLNAKWFTPEKIHNRATTVKRWATSIKEIENPIMEIIEPILTGLGGLVSKE
jgi:hypothetical protein